MDTQTLQNNKWARRAAWTLGGVAALWAISWLAVPPLLKHYAQKIASEKLGRAVTLGAVDFRPWSLALTVSDLAIATADGKADQLRIKRLYIDSELQSLLRLAPVVDAITVDEPVARLTHTGEGRYDIDDILQRLAPPADQPPGEPARFALYNLALNGGSLDFTDQTVGKTHTLRDVRLAVPFLSNLESKRDVHTEPQLAFKLNGSAFDSAGQTTPFAQTRKTDATVKLQAMDLTPYLGYIPASVPVRLLAAVVDADIKVAFEQNPAPAVRLSGVVQVSRVRLADTQQKELLAFDKLKAVLADVRPLAQTIKLASVELTAPTLTVHRARDGRLNLDLSAPPAQGVTKTSKTIAEKDQTALADSRKEPKSSPSGGWKVDVATVAVRGGRMDWTDDTTALGKGTPARLALSALTLDASGIAFPVDLPGVQPIPFTGSAALEAGTVPVGDAPRRALVVAAPVAPAALRFSGTALASAANMTATISDLPLSLGAPYVAQFLEPTLDGTLNAAVGVAWTLGANVPALQKEKGSTFDLKLKVDSLTLDKLALTQGKQALAGIQRVELTDADIDPAAMSATLGKLAVTNPRLKVERDADGRWMVEKWLKGGASAPAGAPSKGDAGGPSAPVAKGASPWKLAINDLLLSGGTVGWSDAATPRPVAFEVLALRVQLQNFALDGKKPAALQVAVGIGAGQTPPGRLSYRGTLGLNPVATQGAVEVVNLPVHAFEPYFGDALNIELLRADASFKGTVKFASSPAGPSVRISGDSAIDAFRANSVQGTAAAGASPVDRAGATAVAAAGRAVSRTGMAGDEELLAWKSLSLRGLDIALAPGTPTRVDVKETALSDFYARVILSESGRLNLQDLVKAPAGSAPAGATATVGTPSAAQDATKTVADNETPKPAANQNESIGSAGPAPQANMAKASASATDAVINFGPVSLVGGRVYFSDRFIKPNYSADMTELTGKLSAFSSVSPEGSPQLADLELRGRVGATASLEILGKLNPLAQPLALDIQGRMRDLELSPLSPYSIKYSGYGIERGKLSVDVGYKVLPSGQLTASNNIVLNQLTFGDKVEGSTGSLPVKLAVALLADRNGVIDINLPISGSLNDPQFSLGSVILKVIVNLITKAITAPFSLLANAFGGGGDELGMVAFAPGSAVLAPQAAEGLDKVAKALVDRPSLTMTVAGTARLDVEREAYKRERLQALVQAEQRRVQGGSSAAPGTATVAVSPADYPALLKAVYKRADIPKPRNLVGMAKDIPQAEMEALLLADIPATDELMRELALKRSLVVRDYLASRQLPPERLFLGAPKIAPDKAPAPTATAASPAAAPWTPRAELALTMK
jgi:uncharacterized protein involved in outer membrane biogenesis